LGGRLAIRGLAYFVVMLFAMQGGTCGFLWGPQFFLDPDFAPTGEEPIPIARSWAWIATAAIVAVVFVIVLGPGIHFA
jgi:hypothetical protein